MIEDNISQPKENPDATEPLRPAWMDDPAIKYIPAEKLDFLSRLMSGTKNLSKNEMIKYIPTLAREAKEHHIQFTREEMQDIISSIRMYSSDSERQTIDKVLSSNPL